MIPPQPVPAEVREYLFGEPNDTMVCVGQCVFPTLLDTGSTVSTISLAGLEFMEQAILYQIEDILHIECADGLNLPYLGYTQTAVKIPGIEEVEQEVVLLVVPNTRFNKAVPLLLGTNVLKTLMKSCQQTLGQSYMKQIKESWAMSFFSMVEKDKVITRTCGRLAVVQSAMPGGVMVQPNQSVIILGVVRKVIRHKFSHGSTDIAITST